MENLPTDFFNIFRFLLPGFLAAWVFYGLSAYERPTQFERIIQAFIFTLVVQLFVSIYAIYFSNSEFEATLPVYEETIVSVMCAIAIGLVFALFANKDWVHFFLRKLRITEQTSYPSEWFGAFATQKKYVVLHLKDERRLYGWPKEWPQTSDKGHFLIVTASWLLDSDNELYLGEKGVEGILVNVEDVKWVEFMKRVQLDG